MYVISRMENFSRSFLAGAISPRQDLTACLIVLRAAIQTQWAPEALVSNSGSIFKAKHAQAICAALGIRKELIAHERFVQNYNHQSHVAHGHRPKGHRSPATILGWVHGAWCDPADLDPIIRLRSMGQITVGGFLRFFRWRLFGERGPVGKPAAVWVAGETLTIEHEAESLAQYGVTLESDGRWLREVGEPRIDTTSHGSPQRFLPTLDEVEWRPTQRWASYRARRQRQTKEWQVRLLDMDRDDLRAAGS